MYCPRCGAEPNENLKYCKVCGANLHAVRSAVDAKENLVAAPGKPWYAEMAVSDAELRRRVEELYHERGIAPEVTRSNEIKGGVITASAGIALSIFLYVFMNGLILGGNVSPGAAEILGRIWLVGIIPIFVGLALIVNGVFVTKRLAEMARRAVGPELGSFKPGNDTLAIGTGDTTEFVSAGFSVTEDATKHLTNQPQHR